NETVVHRRLWRDLLAVGSSGEPWQARGMSSAARALRQRVEESHGPIRASGGAVKELESRPLAVTQEVHTESGRHETMVESWPAGGARGGGKPARSLAAARDALGQAALGIGAPATALPWAPRP